MRIATFSASIMIALAACSTPSAPKQESPYVQPNKLMATEISRRIEQIPYLHRQELVDNLLWLVQSGEQSIPAVAAALQNENAKVRSSAAWVLGMIGDRRTIPELQAAAQDSELAVRLECARTLAMLGDVDSSRMLIEGLDSERKEVRLMCHEALKSATGHDFGYDHLAMNQDEMQSSVLRWRQWWGEYSGETQFAMNYQQQHGIGMPAAPQGEFKQPEAPQVQPAPQPDTPDATPQEQPEASPVETGQTPEPAVPANPVSTPATNVEKVETVETLENVETVEKVEAKTTETPVVEPKVEAVEKAEPVQVIEIVKPPVTAEKVEPAAKIEPPAVELVPAPADPNGGQ